MTTDLSPLRRYPVPYTEASRAVANDPEILAMTEADLVAGIERLRHERDATILAHNYQVPAVQDLADVVGDSLELAQAAAASTASLVVFCGVHFMAETAVLLCQDKRVLIPDPDAGCSLAASVTADDVRSWRVEHPGGIVVAYVNTDADVKAEADYCCTSSNAERVVAAVPENRDVLFVPDQFLGYYLRHRTGRQMQLWLGECHVHAAIRSEDVDALFARYPDAHLLLHPECGCVSQCLFALADGALPADRTWVLSTGGMVRHVRSCDAPVHLVGTETGMLHPLHLACPGSVFVPLRADAVCAFMKTITLPKLYRALRDDVYEVRVPEPVRGRAATAVHRMLELA